MSLAVKPFSGAIGAEVTGIDLSKDLDANAASELRAAWNRHSVLVFRGQKLSEEQQLRFSRNFGPLEVHVLDQYLHPKHREILVVSNVVENGRNIGIPDAGRYWHTDLSYMVAPSRGSILYAIEIPERDGEPLGDTLWASTAAAYDGLPDTMKRRLEGLRAAFSLQNRFQKLVRDGNRDARMTDDQQARVPEVIHPVVTTHPETGRKCLFVNEGHTIRILDLAEDDSRALLDELFAHIRRPDFVYRHKWRPGDVVMWDNLPTQHLAICDYALPQRRLLHRTTITGTAIH